MFDEYLESISEPDQRDKMREILDWVADAYPDLDYKIAWNQPMFITHDTYIIGFSYSKHHIAVSPESKTIDRFSNMIKETGLSYTSNIIRIKWSQQIPYELLTTFIDYNIEDKKGYSKFWR